MRSGLVTLPPEALWQHPRLQHPPQPPQHPPHRANPRELAEYPPPPQQQQQQQQQQQHAQVAAGGERREVCVLMLLYACLLCVCVSSSSTHRLRTIMQQAARGGRCVCPHATICVSAMCVCRQQHAQVAHCDAAGGERREVCVLTSSYLLYASTCPHIYYM